jgi:membrane protein
MRYIKNIFFRTQKVVALSYRHFSREQCTVQASALTFYTLFALIPVLALAFGIAKGFALETLLEKELLSRFQNHATVIQHIIDFSRNMLQRTRGGIIAGIGIASLLWSLVNILGSIENTFNRIWGIAHGRPFLRKVSDYLALMFIGPFLLIIAQGSLVLITAKAQDILPQFFPTEATRALVEQGLALIPSCATWLLLFIIYLTIPNTRVRFFAALSAGVIAGTLYQLFQWGYVIFQMKISTYGAIYGGFAALPLFLTWLYVSWIIILLGAVISYTIHTLKYHDDCSLDAASLSPYSKKLMALRIMHILTSRFHNAESPLSTEEIIQATSLPLNLLHSLLNDLEESNLISKVLYEEKECYHPAHDITTITLHSVYNALERCGSEYIPHDGSEAMKQVTATLEGYYDKLSHEEKACTPLHNLEW